MFDQNSESKIEYDLEINPLDTMPAPGDIVTIQDSSLGQSFTGKIQGYTLEVIGMKQETPLIVNTTLQVERNTGNE